MDRFRAGALVTAALLALSLSLGGVAAQTESATAEDGAPASEAPSSSAAPSVPVGANLTPPVGANLTPPVGVTTGALPIVPQAGTGQSGSASVSMTPGSLTSGVAREGNNAVREPEAEPDAASVPQCGDYPTWYDAQLALESAVEAAVLESLDPDGDTIACEAVMYPEG